MPLVQISLPSDGKSNAPKAVGDCVHDAMVSAIGIPVDDRFQIISVLPESQLDINAKYFCERTPNALIIHITMRRGRTSRQKRDLYAQIVSNLNTRLGLRKEDVMIVLFENELIDWSFGDGIAQIAPPEGD